MNASLLLILGALSVAPVAIPGAIPGALPNAVNGTTPKIVCVQVHSIVAARPAEITTTPEVVLCRNATNCNPSNCNPSRCELAKNGSVAGTASVCQVVRCVPAQGCTGTAVVQVVPGGEGRFYIGGSHAPQGFAYAGPGRAVTFRTVQDVQNPAMAPEVAEVEVDTPDADEPDADDAPDGDDADDDDGEMSFQFEMPEDFTSAIEEAQQGTQQQMEELHQVLERAQQTAHEAQEHAQEAMREATEKAREAYHRAMEQQRGALEEARQARQHVDGEHMAKVLRSQGTNDPHVAEALRSAGVGLQETTIEPQIAEALRSAEGSLRALRVPTGFGMMSESSRADEERVEAQRARSSARSESGGDLESRVAELERIAKQAGHELHTKSSPDGAQPSLEDRVSELERALRGKSKTVRKAPGYGVFSFQPPAPGEAPRAQPYVLKVPGVGGLGSGSGQWSGGTFALPKTPKPPKAPKAKGEKTWWDGWGSGAASAQPAAPGAPALPPMPTTPATPSAGAAPGDPFSPGFSGSSGFPGATPAPRALPPGSMDMRREEIQRAMSELRAEAERLRTEMARMREEIERLPRNQAR